MSQDFSDDRFQEQLQDYLSQELDPDAKQAFDEQLAHNAAAQEELAFSKRLLFAQKHAEVLAVGTLIQQIIAQDPPSVPEDNSGLSSSKFWLGGTLLAALLLAGAWWGISQVREAQTQQARLDSVVAPYLQPLEPLLATALSREEALNTAMQYYQDGNYGEAATAFSAYGTSNNDLNASLYAGVSYLLDQQAKKALPLLEAASKTAVPPVRDAARFYQTLCLLQLGQEEEAKDLAGSIQEEDLYFTQYLELLNTLDQ